MSLRNGAEYIVKKYMDVQPDEFAVIVNDGNDSDLMQALIDVLQDVTENYAYVKYPEPENHGAEPPGYVADILQTADVGIAPTRKSISHTQARLQACHRGTRVATLPGITKDIWNTSLVADPDEVKQVTETVLNLLNGVEHVTVETPRGTDLELTVDARYTIADTGDITTPGDLGNLPPGEVGVGVLDADGTLVVDDFYLTPNQPAAPPGTEITIENREAVALEHPEKQVSPLKHVFNTIPGATNVAEFGVGTNPAATVINNILQDEKVLGTVHVAFGDSSAYLPDDVAASIRSEIHWDIVLEDPTVYFEDEKVLDRGDPVFH